jgi:hypothetical protein
VPLRIRDMVRCDVLHGASVYTSVRGEIQAPLVFVDNTFLSLGVCFVGVPVYVMLVCLCAAIRTSGAMLCVGL